MTVKEIKRLLQQNAYSRTGGSPQEKLCAEGIKKECEALGLSPTLEEFPVDIFQPKTAHLRVGQRELPCRGYYGAGQGSVKGKLLYLSQQDPLLLKRCKGKIVLFDGAMGKSLYEKLLDHGAVGFISTCGNAMYPDEDVDQREFRFIPPKEKAIPGVILHIKHARALLTKPLPEAELTLDYTKVKGTSLNVLLELKGEEEESVTVCAHYDSTLHSQGSYDNMSGAVALLSLAREFSQTVPRKTLRLLWCGSEELGLLGSLAYCKQHPEQLKDTCLNINLDMLGTAMGAFVSFSCADEETAEELKAFAKKKRFPTEVRHGIRSSDCVSFAYYGVPSVSFARYAPSGYPPIHTRYDTPDLVDPSVLKKDIDYITSFTRHVLNSDEFPKGRNISQTVQQALKDYARNKKAFEGI